MVATTQSSSFCGSHSIPIDRRRFKKQSKSEANFSPNYLVEDLDNGSGQNGLIYYASADSNLHSVTEDAGANEASGYFSARGSRDESLYFDVDESDRQVYSGQFSGLFILFL